MRAVGDEDLAEQHSVGAGALQRREAALLRISTPA
jgi:hypothetical protein